MEKIEARISELRKNETQLKNKNEVILLEARKLQQQLAQNNTEILKIQGAIEELEKQIA